MMTACSACFMTPSNSGAARKRASAKALIIFDNPLLAEMPDSRHQSTQNEATACLMPALEVVHMRLWKGCVFSDMDIAYVCHSLTRGSFRRPNAIAPPQAIFRDQRDQGFDPRRKGETAAKSPTEMRIQGVSSTNQSCRLPPTTNTLQRPARPLIGLVTQGHPTKLRCSRSNLRGSHGKSVRLLNLPILPGDLPMRCTAQVVGLSVVLGDHERSGRV